MTEESFQLKMVKIVGFADGQYWRILLGVGGRGSVGSKQFKKSYTFNYNLHTCRAHCSSEAQYEQVTQKMNFL